MSSSILTKIHKKIRNHLRSREEERRFRSNVALVRKLSDAASTPRKLIIDCGFNRGIVAGRLLGELPGFSLIGFEVQQDIQQFADGLKRQFPDRQIEVLYSAVGSRDGDIEYYEATNWGKNYKGGTTTVADKQSMAVNYSEPKCAACIDFAKWLLDHVHSGAFVFVKMDIEGAEYDVIERLLDTGAIERIDVLAVEWHATKFPEPARTRYLEIEKRIKQYADRSRLSVIDWY